MGETRRKHDSHEPACGAIAKRAGDVSGHERKEKQKEEGRWKGKGSVKKGERSKPRKQLNVSKIARNAKHESSSRQWSRSVRDRKA